MSRPLPVGAVSAWERNRKLPASIESICPDFARFWASARESTSDDAVRFWDELYESPHRDIFDLYYSVWGARSQLQGALARFPEVADAIAPTEERLRRALPPAERRVAAQFGLDELAGHYVLLVGLFSSDSWVTDFRGRVTNFYALELLTSMDERILLSHELAHVAHERVLDSSWRPEVEETVVLEALYREGLATLASREQAPSAPDAEILWVGARAPAGWFEAIDACRDDLYAALASSLEDPSRYGEFFLGTRAVRFPPRAGYFVADALARSVSARTDLRSWARAPKSDVRRELQALLDRPGGR